MHPRKPPKQSQSRRKAELGLGPNEHLQRRVGLFWGLTRRAGVAKGPARPCIACPDVSPGLRAARGEGPLATPARVHPMTSQPLSPDRPASTFTP